MGAGQTGSDNYLTSLIPAAQARIEAVARILATQRTVSVRYRASRPYGIILPFGPLAELTSVTYHYDDGSDDVDATSIWRIDADGDHAGNPVIVLKTNPALTPTDPDEITVAYTGGYENVPVAAQTAMLQLIADWYSFRASAEEVLAGRIVKDLPGAWKETLSAEFRTSCP